MSIIAFETILQYVRSISGFINKYLSEVPVLMTISNGVTSADMWLTESKTPFVQPTSSVNVLVVNEKPPNAVAVMLKVYTKLTVLSFGTTKKLPDAAGSSWRVSPVPVEIPFNTCRFV